MNNKLEEEEDFLQVDKPIPGQNFACMSFLDPKRVLEDKNNFLFYNYIKQKFNNSIEYSKFKEDYLNFLESEGEGLTQEFNKNNNFQTSTFGIKIRGVYNTIEEANIRAKVLQKIDSSFNVFVGQVGYWLPWDPNPDLIGNQEYSNDQLNKLAKKYQENEILRDNFYEEEKQKKIKESLNPKNNDNLVDSLIDEFESSSSHNDLKKEFDEFTSEN